MNRDKSYRRARTRVDAKLGFYVHLFIYICVITLLIIINLMSSTASYWFQWPMMGWGLGVALHALAVLFFTRGQTIRRRMIDDELHREEALEG